MDFENLSRNPDDDWIGSGVAESVAAELGRVPGLSVVAREKAIKVRKALGEAAGALELGHALGCRWVLSGSYQRMGPALRMTSRLVETSTGRAVATEKLDGRLEEIFPMQDRLATSTAAVLNLTLPAPADAPAPRSLDAYESHARGRRLFHRLGKGTFDQARELFEQAIAADPEHAPALAGLSAVHAMRFTFTTDPAELERAVSYAERSIAADANLGEPHIWLGYALWRQWKNSEAFQEERRAMELDPGNPFAPYFAGWCRVSAGNPAEAVTYFQRAIEVDPQHGWSWLGVGFSHAELGHFSEARWSLEKAVALEKSLPQSPTIGVSGYLGECLRRMGDPAAARARCLEGIEAVEKSDHMYRDTFRAICLCVLGRAALDEQDAPAARAAFTQAAAHLRGRPRALGGGHLIVQALAGLSRAGEGPGPYEEAARLFENRRGFDFSYLWCCSDDFTLSELSRAAAAIGRTREAETLLERARPAGAGTLRVES
jgi:TolB-like protein/TPR repeat protein